MPTKEPWINPETEDFYPEVTALGEEYGRYQNAVKDVRSQVRAEYANAIRDEISKRTQILESEFAGKIRGAVENGMPGSWIRTAILRTGDWNVWKRWRELAGLDYERKGWSK